MKTFHLQIVTPDGQFFDGQAERVIVRTNNGDVAIMAGHANYVAVLGIGAAVVVTDSERRKAACMGGMLAVTNGEVRVIATAFEWADQIDIERAQKSENRARAVLESKSSSDTDIRLAEARLKRALVRKSVAASHKER